MQILTDPANPRSIDAWLDGCEKQLVHPGLVHETLRRHGWTDESAALVAERYRLRFNEHPLGYAALLVSTGVSALALGTAGHELTAGLTGPVDRNALAVWLSVLLCALPFAGWAHQWAARVDRQDPVAVWSRSRRYLAVALVWGCGVVGGARLITYMVRLVAYLVGASWAYGYSLTAGAINVAIAVGIALPLGLWAHGFLHRFDAEDPTARPTSRRRPSPGSPVVSPPAAPR